jgi:hypothetical protein
MNKVIQTVVQRSIDFPYVNYVELRHYILIPLSFSFSTVLRFRSHGTDTSSLCKTGITGGGNFGPCIVCLEFAVISDVFIEQK